MQIECNIEDAYKMGIREPRPIIVILQTGEDKRKVMSNKAKLKHFKGPNDESFYINDFSTIASQERRKRERTIIKENEEQDDEYKLEIERVKGGIKIQGETYRKKVSPPSPAEMASITVENYDNMMSTATPKGNIITVKDSNFIAFTQAVDTHYEIRELYKKMRLINPGARHIVCAYIISGKELHYCRDFCDDQELGAGRILLDWMKKQNLRNRVFFVVRYCGSMKLSSDRFKAYIDAAKLALESNPYNFILDENQECLQLDQGSHDMDWARNKNDVTEQKKVFKAPAISKSMKRGRGGYHGRGRQGYTPRGKATGYHRKPQPYQSDMAFNFSNPSYVQNP